jgi:hypothetical protein
MVKFLARLGKFSIDAATGFVIVTLLGLMLVPFPVAAQLPPPQKNADAPPKPATMLEIIEMGVDKVPGTPPLLDGWGKFQGAANTTYKVTLLAAPVSGTNPTNEYVVVAMKEVTTNADGVGAVDATQLVDNAPLATSGWYVRLAITGTGGDTAELLTDAAFITAACD